MRFIDRGIVLLLAAIFLFSSFDKVFHYEAFVNAVRNYVLVPRGWAPYLAPSLILVELMIGVGLLVRPWRRSAALTAVFTLAAFTAAISFNYLYGGRGICGCWFTITLANSTNLHLLQNALFLCLALSIWFDEGKRSRMAAAGPPMIPITNPEHPRPGATP